MKPSTEFDQYRRSPNKQFTTTPEDGANGFFVIPMSKSIAGVERIALCIISDGNEDIPWEHVSARISEGRGNGWKEATPAWDEMCAIKDIFWGKDEVVMQLHPAEDDYVNLHPHVLHLWKPTRSIIPLPPLICV
jgi:hypothetical protein